MQYKRETEMLFCLATLHQIDMNSMQSCIKSSIKACIFFSVNLTGLQFLFGYIYVSNKMIFPFMLNQNPFGRATKEKEKLLLLQVAKHALNRHTSFSIMVGEGDKTKQEPPLLPCLFIPRVLYCAHLCVCVKIL